MLRLLLLCLATALTAGEVVAPPATVLDVTVKANDGSDYALSQHRGQVLLLVNTASRCGLTPQYAALEALHARFKDRGFSVIAFPANDFGKQEPGSDADIRRFCTDRYQVTFPLMAKISVVGDGIHPLYRHLTTAVGHDGPIAWNFTKFLVARDGCVIARFAPKTKPDDAALVTAVENAVAVAVPAK